MRTLAVVLALLLVPPGCASVPLTLAPTQLVYCYRTLADIDCLLEPDPDGLTRLVGIGLRPVPDSPSTD